MYCPGSGISIRHPNGGSGMTGERTLGDRSNPGTTGAWGPAGGPNPIGYMPAGTTGGIGPGGTGGIMKPPAP